MDETKIRTALDEIKRELSMIEDRRNALSNLVKNYETLLRIEGKDLNPTIILQAKTSSPSAPSFRGAVLKVIREAHGEPLQARELYKRVEDLGARTNSRNPLSVVALSVLSLAKQHPIEKVAPRTWRWAGD